jgi:magnesium transporter
VTKEVAVGLINGALWAVLVGTIAGLWFDDPLLAGVIAAAMIINQLAAALSGAVIPMVLQRFSIDPALAGGVVLTTVTDVVGFMTFLGLGTLVLLR